eukprot:gb/GFBE01046708.1/.p1 GENE.gb/GFBE01046708.1/~~gb/GFBE01046708.1/.p1  ORF type:complete len:204 (+),score=23.94 gb/GFBE01046708.1/:1-612(+)
MTDKPSEAAVIWAVGSLNPGKLEACRACLQEWVGCSGVPSVADMRAVSAASGVSEQPMGLEETVLGAKNRAEDARANVISSLIDDPPSSQARVLGIALESGLVIVDGKHFDVCACSVFDGAYHAVGFSSMWPIPEQVVHGLQEKGYNGSFEEVLKLPPDDKGDGVLGHLSDGKYSRPAQMKESMAAAVLQLCNPRLYAENPKS